MKKKNIFILVFMLLAAGILVSFSGRARDGAVTGLALAQNTIIPSLLPLLMIFLIIMKTGAKDVLSKCFGFISTYIFNLPMVTFPAIFFGMTGGYPTGALLTNELLLSGEIDEKQARRLLRFNFCGGAGFIITAVGTAVMGDTGTGVILFLSNVLSSVLIGFILSFTEKRNPKNFYSFTEDINFGDALADATESAVKSVLNITAFIVLFSALNNIVTLPESIIPAVEITSGICKDFSGSASQIAAYLSFGGLCIHFQIYSVIIRAKMKYYDFLFFRIIGAFLSYAISKLLFFLFPSDISVFSNSSMHTAEISSVNIALSFLMVIGCFILVFDLSSRKKYV